MKSILKVVFLLTIVIVITVIGCFIFIPDVPKFKETSEFKYIDNKKDDVEEVIIRTVTLLGERCYKIESDKGYAVLNIISFKKKVNMTCTDSVMYLEFYFENGEHRELYFECGNLIYKDEKYELKEEIILYNEDEFVPDEITDSMIIVSNANRVECK